MIKILNHKSAVLDKHISCENITGTILLEKS